MNNIFQWVEGNLPLLLIALTSLLIINLLMMIILTSKVFEIMRQIKLLGFGSNRLTPTSGNGLDLTEDQRAQQLTTARSADHSLPNSLLLEKAIAMTKAGTPLAQIETDLGIDGRHLEILLKQHKP